MILLWHTMWNPDDQVKQQKVTETEDPTQCEGENNDNPGSTNLPRPWLPFSLPRSVWRIGKQ
jgi:hypothetical protein